MKARLNITIEEEVLNKAKVYAEKNGSSVSQLVEDYFKSIITQPKKKSLIEIIEELPKPTKEYPDDFDFTKEYYEENRKKYGF